MGNFVHLHLHSEYSLLDGACRISEIPAAAKAAGHTAVAITDHGVLYGAVAFYDACIAQGVQPIIGCEVYVARRGRFLKEGKIDQSGQHLVLLVKNAVGYRNLCRLVSRSFTEGFYSRPRVDTELLEEYSEGLIALSGCVAGEIPRLILSGDMGGAEDAAKRYLRIFGAGNFYLEIQDHRMEEERQVREGLSQISQKLGIPLVATGDVHYLQRRDADIHAVLMCVQMGTTISEGRPMGFQNDEFYYKTTAEMEILFKDYPEALENTVKIAEKCRFDFTFGKLQLPTFPLEGQRADALLASYAEAGFAAKVQKGLVDFSAATREDYQARMQYELSVIHKMGFDEYYLIVRDFVSFAKEQSIPVGPGRGSGAGSLVAYAIGITDVDPLRFGLLFERFLNPERISMPDFDIDFCYDRRQEVIDYVKRRYGEDHVAQITTFGTMAARAAVRDVGRALGMSYAETDAVAKMIPHAMGVSIRDALSGKELKALYENSEQVKRLLDISMALEGMPRHASTHAAGVVITEKPTCEYVPLAGSGDGIVTEYDMDTVARLGLVKFDFLGLRYLTILSEAENAIREKHPDFDLEKISMADEGTFRMISQGDTMGIFQLESGGMRQMLTQLRPSAFGDIIAAIALYRPGPMDSIPAFIARKHGKEPVSYKTPALESILGETYGCIVYQEQVMEIFRVLAGYSYARADLVRRAMSKKKAEVLAAEQESFVAGCAKNGISQEIAVSIFAEMESFAHYAFNKSHAAAYAVLSYRTAYLMRHYPAEYLSALMTSVLGATGKLGEYIAYAQKKGIPVLPPDINESRMNFAVCQGGIRFGLLALKNIGRPFIEAFILERERGGAFASFEEFLSRMSSSDINRRQIESLIKSGAFDRLGTFRSRLLATFEEQISALQSKNRANLAGQLDLFSDLGGGGVASDFSFSYPDIPELSMRELLTLEKESSGMYFSGHLLDEYAATLEKISYTSVSEILRAFGEEGESESETLRDGMPVSVAGIVTKKTVKNTKAGAQMAFVSLEDRYGEVEVVVFPKVFDDSASFLLPETGVFVQGTLSFREDEGIKILANSIHPLSKNGLDLPPQSGAFSRFRRAERQGGEMSKEKEGRLVLRVAGMEHPGASKALSILRAHGGKTPVLFFDAKTKRYVSAKNVFVQITPKLLEELRKELGKESVVFQENG